MSIAIVNNYCGRRLHMQEFPGKNFTVPLAYMLTAQTNYAQTQGSQTRIYDCFARTVKKMCDSCALLFSVINFLCISLLCKTPLK